MIIVLKYLVLFTSLSSFLWFLDHYLFISVFYTLLFFSVLWLAINRMGFLLNKNGVDPVLAPLALNIGFKFFASLVFVAIMYYKSFFEGNAIIMIFVLFYFIYTYLYAKYNPNIGI